MNSSKKKKKGLLAEKVKWVLVIDLKELELILSSRKSNRSQNISYLYKLEQILNGENLEEIISALVTDDNMKLSELKL